METAIAYWYWQSALNTELCDRIIATGQSAIKSKIALEGPQSVNALTAGGEEIGGDRVIPASDITLEDAIKSGINLEKSYIRDTTVAFIEDQWLYDIVCQYIYGGNEQANWNWDINWFEPLQYGEYRTDQFYGWHADMFDVPYQ